MQKDGGLYKELLIEICNKCYLNCRFCSSKANDTNHKSLSLNLIKKIINDANDLGVSIIQLSGGEPFTHPSFNKICKYISQNKIPFIVYTSGNIKKGNELKALSYKSLKKLKNFNVNALRFNLQSNSEETHNFLTDSKSFYNTIESIKKAIKLDINCEVHLIPLKQNYNDLENILLFFADLNVTKVKFLRFVPHGRGYSNRKILKLNTREYNTLMDSFFLLKNKFGDFIEIGSAFNEKRDNYEYNFCKKCEIGKNKVVITSDGHVYPCVSTKNIEYFDFNLKLKSLKKVLKSRDYKTKIHKFLSIVNNSGKRCPTQKYIELRTYCSKFENKNTFEKKENYKFIMR